MGGENVDERKADSLTVTLKIDVEQLPALQGSIAFLADVCSTYGLDDKGAVSERCAEHKHYGEALPYILYIAAAIGAAVLDTHI